MNQLQKESTKTLPATRIVNPGISRMDSMIVSTMVGMYPTICPSKRLINDYLAFSLSILFSPGYPTIVVSLIFGETRVLEHLTCFLLFFNVLCNGSLEAATILRDARGLYQRSRILG